MSARARTRAHPSDADQDSWPECKYGTSCYRKNPEHFKQFRHPHLEQNNSHKKKKQRQEDHQQEDQDHEQPEEDKDEESQDDRDKKSQNETSGRATRILEQLSQCDVPVLVASWRHVRPALINTILAATSIDLPPLATLIADYCEHSTKSCWRPIAKKQTNVPIKQSKIGGRPFLHPDEKWPCCSVCKSVMPLWLQLNLSELPVEAALELGSPDEMIQLFVCYTDKRCGTASKQSDGTPTHLARKITWNTTQGQPTIRIPKFAGSRDGYDIPERVITGWNEMKDKVGLNDDWFPVCESITLDDYTDLDEDEHKPLEGDKLLGFPQFFNDAVYPSCPTCGVPTHERFTCKACGEGVIMNHSWTCTHRACRDIHLCQSCYDQKAQFEEHHPTHPMTRHDIPPSTNDERMRYIFQIDAEANNVITPFDLDGCWHIYQCAKHKDQLRACYVNF